MTATAGAHGGGQCGHNVESGHDQVLVGVSQSALQSTRQVAQVWLYELGTLQNLSHLWERKNRHYVVYQTFTSLIANWCASIRKVHKLRHLWQTGVHQLESTSHGSSMEIHKKMCSIMLV